MVVARPLQEFGLRDERRLQPDAFLHFSGREPLTPTAAFRFREIHERALFGFEAFEPLAFRHAPSTRSAAGLIVTYQTQSRAYEFVTGPIRTAKNRPAFAGTLVA